MASTYRQVGYGSTGSAVSKLQTVLNQHGYDLAVDGIFGVKTQAAVRDYQKKNSLKLDGSAGPETWGSLLAQSKKDANGNATIGNNIQMIDSKNNIVHTLNEKKVVIQGLEGYIIAEENGTLLICKMSEEQNIKFFSGMN